MRILQVLHDVPWPPRGGGRVDMWGRLRALVALGHEVDVAIAVWKQPSPEVVEQISRYARNLLLCPRLPMWRGMYEAEPCQSTSRRQLRSIKLPSSYDLVLLDGDSVGSILENPSLRTQYRALRTHNWEANYFRERSRISGCPLQVRLYDYIESRRYPKYTLQLIDKCDAVWWVSKDEMVDTVSAFPEIGSKSGWLPHFHDLSRMKFSPRPQDGYVLFVGALSSFQNVEAVTWYLSEIHPKLSGIAGYKFVIAGGTDGHPPPRALSRSQGDSVTLLTDVPDLQPIYAAARLFANPIRHGAGINSKTIHAISEGLPVITTTPGYRGTGLVPGRDLKCADSADQFASCVRDALQPGTNLDALVHRAQDFLEEHYPHGRCLELLLQKLA